MTYLYRTVLSRLSSVGAMGVVLVVFGCGDSTSTDKPTDAGRGGDAPQDDAMGFATPDEAVDAFTKAAKEKDVDTFKKIVARSNTFQSEFQSLSRLWKQSDVVKTEDEAWKHYVTTLGYHAAEWLDAPHKRFPAEVSGDEATVIIAEQVIPGTTSYIYRKLKRIDGKWYLMEFGGIGAEKIDLEKYEWKPDGSS